MVFSVTFFHENHVSVLYHLYILGMRGYFLRSDSKHVHEVQYDVVLWWQPLDFTVQYDNLYWVDQQP